MKDGSAVPIQTTGDFYALTPSTPDSKLMQVARLKTLDVPDGEARPDHTEQNSPSGPESRNIDCSVVVKKLVFQLSSLRFFNL